MKEYRTRIKNAVFEAYGGYQCVCCGETKKIFLTIDHINNDGSKHRKEIGFRGGIGIHLWLHKNNFPPGFQVLCFNCNHGKQLNGGICPHQEEQMKYEESRPEHHVHQVHMPQGHAHMDQKLHKGMRAPIVGSLPGGDSGSGAAPGENGMGSPGNAPQQGY